MKFDLDSSYRLLGYLIVDIEEVEFFVRNPQFGSCTHTKLTVACKIVTG